MRLEDIKRFRLADHTTHESRSLHVLGVTLFLTSLLLIPPTIISIEDGDSIDPFIWPMIFGLILSIFLTVRYKSPETMRPSDGIAMMVILWIALFIFGTIPYLIYGVKPIDAIFETVSGFTTVGASVLTDVESYSNGILLWRVLTQWIGGMMIVIMFMFIMPMVVSGGRGLLSNEMSGSGSGHMFMKMRSAAQQFIGVYITLSLVFFIILLLLGVKTFDSVYIAMSTISTGGFMNHNDSMTSFSSPVKLAVTVFMILSASNYYLHFRLVTKKDYKAYGRSEEFRTMLFWFLFMIIIACIGITINESWGKFSGNLFDGVTNVAFSIVSMGTTTGFSTTGSFYEVASIGMTFLIVMMIVGGSSGSTSGGIKISRVIILVKAMINEIRQQIHPNAVYSVRYDKAGLPEGTVRSAMVTVIMFAGVVGISTVIFNLSLKWDDSIYTAIAIVAGNGSSQGVAFANYENLPDFLKIFSCFLMFLGRMEFICILALFTKAFWKEYLGVHQIDKMKKDFKDSLFTVFGLRPLFEKFFAMIGGMKKKKGPGDGKDDGNDGTASEDAPEQPSEKEQVA